MSSFFHAKAWTGDCPCGRGREEPRKQLPSPTANGHLASLSSPGPPSAAAFHSRLEKAKKGAHTRLQTLLFLHQWQLRTAPRLGGCAAPRLQQHREMQAAGPRCPEWRSSHVKTSAKCVYSPGIDLSLSAHSKAVFLTEAIYPHSAK